jgi:hypothetical protein
MNACGLELRVEGLRLMASGLMFGFRVHHDLAVDVGAESNRHELVAESA